MLDEMFARKNQWERAQPFSIIRTSLILLEALIGLAALIVVSLQLVDYAQKAGL